MRSGIVSKTPCKVWIPPGKALQARIKGMMNTYLIADQKPQPIMKQVPMR